jgi:hypothetical protein
VDVKSVVGHKFQDHISDYTDVHTGGSIEKRAIARRKGGRIGRVEEGLKREERREKREERREKREERREKREERREKREERREILTIIP